MSEKCENIDSILRRNARDQEQRYNKILDPDSLKLHDLEIEDWMLFAYNFAKHINYFKPENDSAPSGDWQDLFRYFSFNGDTIPLRGESAYQKLKDEITATLAAQEKEGEVTPHFTLFICFLKLLSLSQERFNGLTKRHLDFYYKEILKVEKLAPEADKVHVLFEIAKKSVNERVAEGTELDSGKDADGNKRIYKTSEELIANKAQVAVLKNIHNDFNSKDLKVSEIANSYGGNGDDFPDTETNWWPFGYPSTETNYPELDTASIGFSIASPLLLLQEGKRKVTITISFQETLESMDPQDLADVIEFYGTGEEDWVGPFKLDSNETKIQDKQLILGFTLEKDIPGIVGYNPEIIPGAYDTAFPIFRFLIDQNKEIDQDGEVVSSKGYSLYTKIATKTLESIKIFVDVDDVTSLALENDTGVLNANKPFYPFTTQPVIKSNFYIDYPELFSKQWRNMRVQVEWKNTPPSFNTLYKDYGTAYQDIQDSYFTAKTEILRKEIWEKEDQLRLFTINEGVYTADHIINNTNDHLAGSSGPLRFSLNKSFLHSIFPRVYAIAIAQAIKDPKLPVPGEPYTPLIETISLDYEAEEITYFSKYNKRRKYYTNVIDEKGYRQNRIKLFHENAFGQHEEHGYLKKVKKDNDILDQDDFNTTIAAQENSLSEFEVQDIQNNSTLIPTYCRGGSLLIGLEEAQINQQISLLIQVLEGSENPNDEGFLSNQRVEWSVLCSNHWKDIQDDIIINSTDNLLKSGIIKFGIPKQATSQNTRLPDGYIWIRARIHKKYNAVSKVKAIHAQAVVAVFDDRNNELSHLENSLPNGSISKLITRVPQIKSISQPYNSFDGSPQESDETYYRRISERLRHKNRAITLWDYENLVLQKFPEIYQVKCLNHTNMLVSPPSFLSPGHVALVVIPDTINKNVFDIFQPRVSKATLNKVKRYINKLNTMHVTTEVVNPTYEEVEISLSVKFFDQYDENFYTKQLSEDITKFLSPWAFDTSRTIDFGVTLHRSVLIDYLEELYYVDFLQDVILKKEGKESGNSLEPSNPTSILVSAKNHQISTNIQGECKESNEATIETCEI